MKPWLLFSGQQSTLLSSVITAVSGCRLCLVADENVILSAGKVSTWSDASGLGNNATQPSESLRPTLVTNVYNGKNAVRFSSSTLTIASFPALPFTFLVAVKASASYNGIIDTAPGVANVFRIGNGGNMVDYWNVAPAFNLPTPAGSPVLIATGGAMGSTRAVKAYMNGTELTAVGDPPSASNIAVSSGSINLGAINSGSAGYLDGDLLCVTAWNRSLSDPERNSIETAIRTYYGF